MQHNISNFEIILRPSRYWFICTLLGMVVAGVACFHLSHVALQIISLLLLVVYCCYIFQRYYRLTLKSSILGIRYSGDHWWIKGINHKWTSVTIDEPPTVTAFLTVIPFRVTKYRNIFVAIFSDSSDAESCRRLRVLLRLRSHLLKK